jgi:hypothetical protein
MTLTSLHSTVGATVLLMATGAMGGSAMSHAMPKGRIDPDQVPWLVAGGFGIIGSVGGAALGVPDMLVRTVAGRAGDGAIHGPGRAGVIAAGIGAAVLVAAAATGAFAWTQHAQRSHA